MEVLCLALRAIYIVFGDSGHLMKSRPPNVTKMILLRDLSLGPCMRFIVRVAQSSNPISISLRTFLSIISSFVAVTPSTLSPNPFTRIRKPYTLNFTPKP